MVGLWTGISTQAFLAGASLLHLVSTINGAHTASVAMLYTTVARVINPEWTPTPSQSYAIYLAVIVLGALTLLAAGTRLVAVLVKNTLGVKR